MIQEDLGKDKEIGYQGMALQPQQAQAYEDYLRRHPDDRKIRIELMTYNDMIAFGGAVSGGKGDTAAAKSFFSNYFWLLKQSPASPALQEIFIVPAVDPQSFHLAGKQWGGAVNEQPKDSRVLFNAGRFFYENGEQKKGADLLERAVSLDANNGELEWWTGMAVGQDHSETATAKALVHLEHAATLAAVKSVDGQSPSLDLSTAANVCLGAKKYTLAKKYAQRAYGGKRRFRQELNLLLAEIAIEEQGPAEAEKYLGRAGVTPAEATSFNFSMNLPRRLWEAGEKKVVLKFLERLQKAWKSEKLDSLVEEAKKGGEPGEKFTFVSLFRRQDTKAAPGGHAVGKTAAQFKLTDLEGREVSLEEVYAQGPVILDFWATWCGPCRNAAPVLAEAVASANSKAGKKPKIQVLSIDLREDAEKVSKFLGSETKRANYSFLLDKDGKVSDLYGADAIPTIVFIEQGGKVMRKIQGFSGNKDLSAQVGKLAGAAIPVPGAPMVEPPYLIADFDPDFFRSSNGGTTEFGDSVADCLSKPASTLEVGEPADGALKRKFLRWDFNLDKDEVCGQKPWAWTMFFLPQGEMDFSKCTGVRYWVRAHKPGLKYVVKFQCEQDPCVKGENSIECPFKEAPLKWTQVSVPLTEMRRVSEEACPFNFKHIYLVNLVVGGYATKGTLDFDQIEFY
jgi:thiol-disulfide isomerase/thioredoxin/Tfp pilus assembly protein PilF